MATNMESSMNVSALKLADPYVKSIVDTAAHVALYSFNSENYEWEKLNVEGALFLSGRTGEPKHNLMILNRLNTFNLIEPITEGLDLQLQDPFLLYRNVQGQINGIWFYDKDECVRIAGSLEKLVRESASSGPDTPSKPPDPVATEDKIPDGTNKRVMDFFAKASNSRPHLYRPNPPPGLRHDVEGKVAPAPLLHMLIPDPVRTVEQIERQQRTATPQKDVKPEDNTPRRVPKLENGLVLLSLNDCSPPSSGRSFFDRSPASCPPPIEVSHLEKRPALIPPVMFVSSNTPAASEEEATSVSGLPMRPEPLTKTQLLQAVTYLLKNDSDFINKLHEAYVKSFVDMVS
ncbi:hypothetical protein AAG570_009783 [Ranatra chinensis]|uniref:mRNA-decapping enzyme C-terminal domain-containing protein n=1 Tax=Ranatra chinensis TaxID=642074 RepID=A0ABD0Z767_9HEMI